MRPEGGELLFPDNQRKNGFSCSGNIRIFCIFEKITVTTPVTSAGGRAFYLPGDMPVKDAGILAEKKLKKNSGFTNEKQIKPSEFH